MSSVTKVVPGLLIAKPSPADVAGEACARMARAIRDALTARGGAAIAISGGNSPLDAYRLLAAEPLDWSKIKVFWVDDRAVPPTHERSNYFHAKTALLDPAAIPEPNVFRMRGESGDLETAARDYEATVREHLGNAPRFDLVILGVGDDGHTASLFPGESTVHVTDRLVAAVPAKGEREARLTLTVPVLEEARTTVLIVVGKAKNPALERIWATSGDLDATPARVVRTFKGAVVWVIDRAAGGIGLSELSASRGPS